MGHGFGFGDRSCIDLRPRRVVRVFSAFCRLAAYSTGRSYLRLPPWSRFSLGPAWAVGFSF